jgi:hypothetical protein
MATRSIVTSQPDVACDVCERRLLRGEQPDLFLAAGQPRIVCELCAPRAAHQGWTRGSDQLEASSRPLPSRRGRRLFERLRQTRAASLAYATDGPADTLDQQAADALDVEDASYYLLGAQPDERSSRGGRRRVAPAPAGSASGGDQAEDAPAPPPRSPADQQLQRALDVFNAGPYTRRVASLTRSLGAPEVTVRPGEAVATCVVIVLAWELCWYVYEVDLDNMQGVEALAVAQGTELSELAPHDRLANALADERGALSLS